MNPKDMVNIMNFFINDNLDFNINDILCDSDYADEKNKIITIRGNRDFKNERIDVCKIFFTIQEDSDEIVITHKKYKTIHYA